jgi:parvulin-like peptidyl-prolyl isomerase
MTVRKWIAKGLLSAGLLAGAGGFALAQVPSAAPGAAPAAPTAAPGAKPPAVVNNEPITMQELESVMRMAGAYLMPMTAETLKQRQLQTLAAMIDEVLLTQFLKKEGPQVPATELAKREQEMEAELKKEKGKTLDDFCKETGQTRQQFREDIYRLLQWEAYVGARVTEATVQQAYTEYRDFFDGVTVRASHIVLQVPPTAPEADKQAARQKLAAIREQILAGKLDFAVAAKTYSACPSKDNGGDIGYFARKFMVDDAFAKAAFALQPNQISDIVQTDFGLHLIRVVDRKAGQPSDFAKIKDGVKAFCAEDIKQQVLSYMRKNSKVEVNLQ